MTTLNDIVAPRQHAYDAAEAERARLTALISRHQKKLDSLPRTTFMDVVRDIAAAVCLQMPGLKPEFYGPFGLYSEFSFYLENESGEAVAGATFVPNYSDGVTPLIRIPGDTKRFPANSIGAINGGNDIDQPLPETIEELVAMLNQQVQEWETRSTASGEAA